MPAVLLAAAKRLETVDAGLARMTYLKAIGAAIFAGRLADPGADLATAARAARAAPPPPGTPGTADRLLDGLAANFDATQRPLAVTAFTEKATAAGWKTIPSWYLVASHDNAIPPEAERFMAQRMGSTIEEIDGSHTAFIAQPVRTAEFIKLPLAKH